MNQHTRLTEKQICIRIPKQYHHEPVISDLISHHHVTVTITAALLSTNINGDGWFDLKLQGTEEQINSALSYINDLDLELLDTPETDGW
jgi:NIL domain